MRDWRDAANCAGCPEGMFPAIGESSRMAVRVCGHCTVRVECLADALTVVEQHGVRGGLTERQRRALLRKQRTLAVA